ncbi:hypothetical protein [Aeromicrobium piscarium]|uniref:DUF2550 family protein n=1 Tax=Aeromicrobium piscarium TaxID=2590901 RepID=A0A554RV86_9ACTN|nr:hypothetical protein [Aeromicrobium piscarium]TSD58022.1 hypothetical protein FNM00_15325 [Aeromicrobium piscarium]
MLDVVLYVLAALGLVVVTLMIVGALRVARMRRGHRRALVAAGVSESTAATLFGVASDRRSQRPGPGTLGLGDETLIFVQVAPQREVRVPREEITSAQVDTSFMGRAASRPLLVVTWDAQGMGDAAAFVVPDAESWRQRLT